MASKRMFNLSVIDTDAFLEMPTSTQALYFHLNMRADDDGFIGSPKIICRTVGASEDDLKLLIAKRFVLLFEDGVIVIKHWRMHNNLSRNRYVETNFIEDKAFLRLKPNNAYTLSGDGIPLDDTRMIEAAKRQVSDDRRDIDAQKTRNRRDIDATKTQQRRDIDAQKTHADKNSIVENRIDKNSIDKGSIEERQKYKHVNLTEEELQNLRNEYGDELTQKAIRFLDNWLTAKRIERSDCFYQIKKWVIDAVREREAKASQKLPSFGDATTLKKETSLQFNKIADLIEQGVIQ